MTSLKRFVSAAILVLILLCSSVSAFALPEELVDISSLSVRVCVYVEFYYADGSYGGFATSSGTGLLVGNGEEKTHVFTNASAISGDAFDRFVDGIAEECGFEYYNVGVPQVYFGAGQITTVDMASDPECDVALLELGAPVYVPHELTLRRFDTVGRGEKIFLLSYAETEDGSLGPVATEGVVIDWNKGDYSAYDFRSIKHSAPVPEGSRGGFLVDSAGSVIGIIDADTDDDSAVSSEALAGWADMSGLSYETSGRPDNVEYDLDRIPADNDVFSGENVFVQILRSVPLFLWVLLALSAVICFVLFVVFIVVLCTACRKKRRTAISSRASGGPGVQGISPYRLPDDLPGTKR